MDRSLSNASPSPPLAEMALATQDLIRDGFGKGAAPDDERVEARGRLDEEAS
jgi:hypothetical protein